VLADLTIQMVQISNPVIWLVNIQWILFCKICVNKVKTQVIFKPQMQGYHGMYYH